MPSLSVPSPFTSTLVTAGVTLLMGTSYYCLIHKKKKKKKKYPCREIVSASELRGNASASGSDVVRIYKKHLANNLYIVTGATSGLGRHTATLLACSGENNNTHVILAVRNVSQGEKVAMEIKNKAGNNTKVDVWHLDLTSLDSVREFATKFANTIGKEKKLDGLINNAGVYCKSGTTMDGYQITWQTNSMAPALLTELLLPYMSDMARIIHVSSEMEMLMCWSITKHCPPQSDGSGTWDYALSKACQVLHAHQLTVRFQEQDYRRRIMAVEPGLVETNIARHASPIVRWINYKLLGPLFLRSVDQGCATTLYCLLCPDLEDTQDYYYANCAPRKPTKCCQRLEEVQAQANLFETIWNT